MPVRASIIQRRMVTIIVMTTRVDFRSFFISPSIFSSMVFWEKGKIFLRSTQAIRIMTMTSGTMKIIH